MDEKKLKEVEELLTGAEQDIESGKVEEAKAKIASAKDVINGRPLPGTGSNGHL